MNGIPLCQYEKVRKARKEHKCTSCRVKITHGDDYVYLSGIWDDGPADFKFCTNCYKIISIASNPAGHIDSYDDELPTLEPGGVREWLMGCTTDDWRGEEFKSYVSSVFGVPMDYLNRLLCDD